MTALHLRSCIFRPYRKGCGPVFRLDTWTIGKTDERGVERIGYRLTQHQNGNKATLFEGDPRGACVKLILPSGRNNSWGGAEEGFCVPTR